MANKTVTDNGHLKPKLELRRYFLQKYHTVQPPKVFDCCQGSKVIWTQLQTEFSTALYWGVDLKPKKGRLKIDSEKILNQPGWNFDVIDCDTYGSPWKHYGAIQTHATKPLTLFLTIGQGFSNFAFTGLLEIQAIFGKSIRRDGNNWVTLGGIPISPFFISATLPHATERLVIPADDSRLQFIEAVEAMSASQTARYIGIRLEPKPLESGKA